MSTEPEVKPRRKRRWLRWVGVLAVIVLVIVALLPSLINMGLGQGLIRNAISGSINGSATFQQLRIGWLSGQSVEGLVVKDAAGAQVAQLNIKADAGLLKLLLGRSTPLNISISGAINGEIHPDGRLNLAELSPDRKPGHAPKPKPANAPSGKPFDMASLPPTTIQLDGLSVALHDQRDGRKFTATLTAGRLAYTDPQQPVTIDIAGDTTSAEGPGKLSAKGEVNNLIDGAGKLTLRGASARLAVNITAMPLLIAMPGSDAPARINSLTLTLASSDLTGKILAELQATPQVQGSPASDVKATIDVGSILSGTGSLSLRAATAHATIEVAKLPLQAGGVVGMLDSLQATIASDDLTRRITIVTQASAQVEGHPASTLTGNLSTDDLLTPDGGLTFKPEDIAAALAKVTGTITGQRVPTPLIQPFLVKTPILASRDLGDVVDVRAEFTAGQKRDVTITIDGGKAKLALNASVNQADNSVVGSNLLLSMPAVQPELVEGFTTLKLDKPADLELHLTSFTIPAKNTATDSIPLAQMAMKGTVTIKGPLGITLPAGTGSTASPATAPASPTTRPEPPFEIRDLVMNLDSPGLGDRLVASGSVNVDGGTISFNQSITHLLDATGGLDAANALPVGTITISKLPASSLAPFIPADQRPLAKEVIGTDLNAAITTALQQDGSLLASLDSKTQRLSAMLAAQRKPDGIAISGGTISVEATPKLVALAQRGREKPIRLASPATITLEIQPFDIPRGKDGTYAIPALPVQAGLSASAMTLDGVPSLAAPLVLSNLSALLEMHGSENYRNFIVNGDVVVGRGKASQQVAGVRYQARIERQGEGTDWAPHVDIGLADLSVPELEALLGKPAGTLSQWTGDAGTARIFVEHAKGEYNASLKATLTNLEGEFSATGDGRIFALAGGTTSMRLSQETLQKRMNPPTEAAEPKAAAKKGRDANPADSATETIEVLADVPATLTIQRISFPVAMLNDEPFDPAAVLVDMSIEGGPLRMKSSSGLYTSLRDLNVKVGTVNLRNGLDFTLQAKADASEPEKPAATAPGSSPPGASKPGRSAAVAGAGGSTSKPADLPAGIVDIKGKLVDLVTADSRLGRDTAKLQLTATANTVPTAIADALTNMQGLLVAAVGPMMNAQLTAEDFSQDSGDLNARIDTTNGWLTAVVRGKDQSLRSAKSKPIQAELNITRPLRERLLMKINPILADIRTTAQPLRVNIPYAVLPTNGDASQLKADIEITVGKVEFDSGSTTLEILSLFNQKGKETIPGEIEPIIAKIRNGIVKYDRFAVHIDRYVLNYSGQIDLVKGEVDLRTEIPLKALGDTFKELEGYADTISVPLVTRGKFGSLKTTIDPKFDLGKAALDAGFKGTLNNLLNGKSGNLLDDLIKGGKKKKP